MAVDFRRRCVHPNVMHRRFYPRSNGSHARIRLAIQRPWDWIWRGGIGCGVVASQARLVEWDARRVVRLRFLNAAGGQIIAATCSRRLPETHERKHCHQPDESGSAMASVIQGQTTAHVTL
jgi:hypothetical protein